MGIEHIFTLQTGQGSTGQNTGSTKDVHADSAAAKTQGANGGVFADGLSFFDFMLARVKGDQAAKDLARYQDANSGKNDGANILQSDNPALAKDPALDLKTILAATPALQEQVEKFSTSAPYSIGDTLALNQQVFDNIMVKLPDGDLEITEEERVALEAFKDKAPNLFDLIFAPADNEGEADTKDGKAVKFDPLARLLSSIETSKTDASSPANILSDMSAAQITDLKAYIKELERFEYQENSSDNIQGLAFPTPPESLDKIARFLNTANIGARGKTNIATDTPAALDTAAKDVKSAGTKTDKSLPLINHDAHGFAGFDEASTQVQRFNKFLQSMDDTKDIKNGPVRNSDLKDTLSSKDISATRATPVSGTPVFSSMEAMSPLSGFMSGDPALGFMSGADSIDSLMVQSTQSAPNGLSALTNTSLQSAHATTPHPAVSNLAIKIQKNASNGETRNINIQLDPPDLGRLEVRMSFDKDKTMKASIIIEKPETHLMLQRDANALERALADAGVDIDGGGLEFELADQDHDFSHNGDSNDDLTGNTHGQNAIGEPDITETTMNWSVDPATGHMQYSILV